jgi:GGDEF domain-containing protein
VLGRRLLGVLGPGTALARLGGDDFAVVAAARSREDLVRLCDRLLQTARRPIVVAGHPHPLRLSLSVGAHLARPGEQAGDVLAAATRALRTARAAGARDGEHPSYRRSGSI